MPWQPAHDAHSIERVTLSFLLMEALPARGWQKALDVAGERLPTLGFHAAPDQPVLPNLPMPFPGGALQIRLGPGGLALEGPAIGGLPASRSFQRVVEGQAEGQIIVSRNGIVATTTTYDRWRTFRDGVLEAVNGTLGIIQEISSISFVKFEVWDRFISLGAPEAADFGELLRNDSPHVPRFATTAPRLWHSHVGYFDEPGRSAQRLVNMNLDAVDIPDAPPPEAAEGVVSSRRSLGIYTMVQDTPHKGGDMEPIDDVGGLLDEMHRVLNTLLLGVITHDAARRIHLIS